MPGASGSGEADDYHLLALAGLDLEPVPAAHAGEVGTGSALGDDAFLPVVGGLLEIAPALTAPVPADRQQLVLGDDLAQPPLALNQGQGP